MKWVKPSFLFLLHNFLALGFLLMISLMTSLEGITAETGNVPGFVSEYDRINLEKNLRWILERERKIASGKEPKPRLAVFADAGVWHVGACSIVEALENEKIPCRVIDRSLLTEDHLKEYEGLILPGGWAPLQASAAGEKGLKAIEKYITAGGRCLAICAGAYLVSKTVKYEGKQYPYPIGIFDGVAIGPVKGGASFPKPGAFKLTLTEEGKKRGLDLLPQVETYYSGGPFFQEGTRTITLATYPDGSSGLLSRAVGKGELILCGVHVERPSPKEGDDKSPPPKHSGPILKTLLQLP